MKESQARALEELAKKHRLTLENALNSAEKDKNRLLTVSLSVYLSFCLSVRLSVCLSIDCITISVSQLA